MKRIIFTYLISCTICSCYYEGEQNELNITNCPSCKIDDTLLKICDNEDGTAFITMTINNIDCLTKLFDYREKQLSFNEISESGCDFFKKYFYKSNCLMCDTFTICDNGDGRTFTYTNFFSGSSFTETFEYSTGLNMEILKAVGCN